MKKNKTRYEKLLEQYNERQDSGNCCQTPLSNQKNVLSMVFGAIFILFNIGRLLHGDIIGFLALYFIWGAIFAICLWVQMKYINKASQEILSKYYFNCIYVKYAIAWLPSIFSNKVTKWIYS